MAVKFPRSSSLKLVLSFFVTTSVLAIIATAHWPWPGQTDYCWRPCEDKNTTKRVIVVGDGSWRFGFNYSEWAAKTGPFNVGDTLVFKYASPDDPAYAGHNHSVYLLRGFPSYQNCSLEGAIKLAGAYDGSKGYNLTLAFGAPHFLACGEKEGFHCNQGLMKFIAWPMFQ